MSVTSKQINRIAIPHGQEGCATEVSDLHSPQPWEMKRNRQANRRLCVPGFTPRWRTFLE